MSKLVIRRGFNKPTQVFLDGLDITNQAVAINLSMDVQPPSIVSIDFWVTDIDVELDDAEVVKSYVDPSGNNQPVVIPHRGSHPEGGSAPYTS